MLSLQGGGIRGTGRPKHGEAKGRGGSEVAGGGEALRLAPPPPQSPLNRVLVAIADYNRALQEAQKHFLPVQGAVTCKVCENTKGNPHHSNAVCAFFICRR